MNAPVQAWVQMTPTDRQSTPSADDLACPIERLTYSDGFSYERLRPYWQQHPGLSESPITFWGEPLNVAWWRDGVASGVPANADAKTLMNYYLTARIIAELDGHILRPRNVPRGGGL